MTKLEDILDLRIVALVNTLISESITKEWLKDILQGKKFKASRFDRDWSESYFFIDCVWDNLSDEQKSKVIESLNMLIEEDILINKQPFGNYCFDLLDLAILLEKKIPKRINSKPFIIWMEKDFYNLPNPENRHSPLREELRKKINYAFKS